MTEKFILPTSFIAYWHTYLLILDSGQLHQPTDQMTEQARAHQWVLKLTLLTLIRFFFFTPLDSHAQDSMSDVGNFYPFLEAYSTWHQFRLSFLSESRDVKYWRTKACSKPDELLAFHPEPSPLNAEILDRTKRQGYT